MNDEYTDEELEAMVAEGQNAPMSAGPEVHRVAKLARALLSSRRSEAAAIKSGRDTEAALIEAVAARDALAADPTVSEALDELERERARGRMQADALIRLERRASDAEQQVASLNRELREAARKARR